MLVENFTIYIGFQRNKNCVPLTGSVIKNHHCVNNIVSRLCKWTNKSWLPTGTSRWYQKNSWSWKQSLLIQNKCAVPKCNKYCATLNETLTGKSCMEIIKSTCKAISVYNSVQIALHAKVGSASLPSCSWMSVSQRSHNLSRSASTPFK